MNEDEAREYFEANIQVMTGGWRHLLLADRLGVLEALDMTIREYAEAMGGHVRLGIPERREAVAEMSDEGLTQREVADVLGVGVATVNRDMDPVPNGTTDDTSESVTRDDAPQPVPNGTTRPEPTDEQVAATHVTNNTGNNEWYTPTEFIEAARTVMDGIDLDPASNESANAVVQADRFYSIDDDGLTQPWHGRIWMNPPYGGSLIGKFVDKLVEEHEAGRTTQAVVLVNNGTETGWFQKLWKCSTAVCFPAGRIRFWYPGRPSLSPLQGQVFLYLGPDPDQFRSVFGQFGADDDHLGGSS
jgi:hypothetical protein